MFPVLQQDIIDEAIEGHFRQATVPATLCTLGDGTLSLPKGQAFIELGMRVRLTLGCLKVAAEAKFSCPGFGPHAHPPV